MMVRFNRTGVLALLVAVIVVVLFVGSRVARPSVTAASACPRFEANSLDLKFEWTIFITPQSFVGPADQQQRRAIKSWLRLTPKPRVVLAGQGEGYDVVAKDLGLEVNPNLDLNFAMLPLAGSLLHLASTYPTEIACIVNSDILLSQSFANALAKTRKNFDHWFLTGARYDVDSLPPEHDPTGTIFDDAHFSEYIRSTGTLHTAGGLDYFVWNNGRPLIKGTMPPFIRGKSKFDNWIVHEVIQAGYREVVDGSNGIVVAHVVHNYQSADGKVAKAGAGGGTFWQKDKTSNWMIFHNNHLAMMYGSYRNQDGTSVHAPWKLLDCYEPAAGNMCLQRRVRPGICPCEHNAFAHATQNDPEVISVAMSENEARRSIVRCGAVSQDSADAFHIHAVAPQGRAPVFGLPFTLRDLLPMMARNNMVILTGITHAYRDVLMNFVCNLRRLGIYDSLVIAAFDEEAYRFGFRMGLPVFYYQSQLGDARQLEAAYGSEGFKSLTKLKSQIALEILRLGYDVVWTDSDIVWFQNPLPLLAAMPSDLVVQSNAPWPDEPAANGPLRINSGFYRARATPVTIAAFDAIVNHAHTSHMSEQPSFYIVLCGGKDGVNVRGDSQCVFRPSADAEDVAGKELVVEFLPRLQYPNGAVGQLWEAAADLPRTNPEVVILHNNWIRGLPAKARRLVEQRVWWYDRAREICDYRAAPVYEFNWKVDEMSEE